MKKRILCCFLLSLLLLTGSAWAESAVTSIEQLNDPSITLGIPLSSAAEVAVPEQLPKAKVVRYNDNLLGFLDVASGRIDAYVYDEVQLKISLENGVQGVRMLDEVMDLRLKICAGISPVSEIPDLENKVNRFIAEMKEGGVIEDMRRRWIWDAARTMPAIELPADPQYHLVVATSGVVMPYSYYQGKELTGFDIELAYRFAQWLGADVKFVVYDYGSIVQAAISGKADLVLANLQYTDERAQSGLIFSDELYATRLAVLVRDDGESVSVSAQPTVSALDALNGKRIGVATDTAEDKLVAELLPQAKIEYFKDAISAYTAVSQGKLDAFVYGKRTMETAIKSGLKGVRLLDETLGEGNKVAVGISPVTKIRDLKEKFDAFIDEIRADGTLEDVQSRWLDRNEENMPEIPVPETSALRLAVGTVGSEMPYAYYVGNTLTGRDIELAWRFAAWLGAELEFKIYDYEGIIAAAQGGDVDCIMGNLYVTPERAESISFSKPYEIAEVGVMVRDTGVQADEYASFWDGIVSSFNKTFLRENRWELFGNGVLTTLLITILSILFGTALGFGIFMLCRNGNIVANGVTRFSMWLVQGMPMVVLLMILYYIIFGSVAISGIFVAVIGFTLTFGASVFGLLKMGVGTIDRGQYEAAYALGYANRRTFFRIILPQAISHILPAYKGEIVGLVKATAIVGYIAVQDLTKMGDIVRSRTYEAFFPLIAVTVIYFVMEGLLGFLVSKMQIRMNPKKRKRESILKGVKTHV